MSYNPSKIEPKWQKKWEELKLYRAEDFSKKPKQYILIEFPYPSGEGLHVGHIRSYSALDALARKKRMEGYNVIYPIGWDAFGLPTENYAIKKGIHPSKITESNIKTFKRQLKSLGLSFDWSREINTTDPQYYKWTQWIFLQFFKKGLAHQAEMPINWCPSCKIGLANEEVIQGKCERCGSETERKKLKQWMLKITKYADRLIENLKKVDYLEKIKIQQINWIGKSYGTNLEFKIKDSDLKISVFTTRVDTIFGVTAIVLAPEHRLVTENLSLIKNRDEVEKYIKEARKKSDLERTDLAKEKTGVELKGIKAINPVTGKEIPVWVGDYVIATYGGGSVMVVPAHDQRDFEFAERYNLPIIEVIKPIQNHRGAERGANDQLLEAFESDGILVNSGEFSGLTSAEAREKITQWLKEKKLGGPQINYKLRDWIFSRQHYWGEPIPLVFCPNCKDIVEKANLEEILKQAENAEIKSLTTFKIQDFEFYLGEILNPGWIAIPEEELPVELPYVEKYQPTGTGESPLAQCQDWVKTKCPKCHGPAERETDTMPNWAGSSWYYLAYLMRGVSDNLQFPISRYKKVFEYWLPVDLYNGGMEHTTLHLLYSRFWYQFLFDLGVVPNDEPYARRRSHGMVLGEDGEKMSKSRGNVINPDEMVKKYGADALRVYEMFMGPFDQAISWSTQGLVGVWRFLNRVYSLVNNRQIKTRINKKNVNLERIFHQTIKKVGEDLESLHFNTAVAALMSLLNEMEKNRSVLTKAEIEIYLKLLAPFAPHLSEELWQIIRPKSKSIFLEKWPIYDPELIKEEEIELIIQVNGRIRDKIKTRIDISEQEAKDLALKSKKVQKYLADQEIKKIIFVPKKLINFVI
ncbi:MAG: leucine--tRNA ligase [Patescibacteria group bacterium]